MKNIQIKYPNKLKELRKAHNLKQTDISAYMGFTGEERISRWERGQALPSLRNIIKLTQLFKVKIEDIYSDIG